MTCDPNGVAAVAERTNTYIHVHYTYNQLKVTLKAKLFFKFVCGMHAAKLMLQLCGYWLAEVSIRNVWYSYVVNFLSWYNNCVMIRYSYIAIKTHGHVSCGQVLVRETLCYLHELCMNQLVIFSHYKNHSANFNWIHVLDALQSCYLTCQIWKESTQQFLRYTNLHHQLCLLCIKIWLNFNKIWASYSW